MVEKGRLAVKGFHGRVLKADAGMRSFEIEEVSEPVLAACMGGKGLGTQLLVENSAAGADPLSPENPIVFGVGPVTDTRVPGSSRYGVFSKSPQTGLYSESYSGGKLAEKISRTGFDAVVITGAAEVPVYLEVTEEGAAFRDAGDLWGMETYAAEDVLRARHGGKQTGAAVIGPAGENLVRFAIIANDYWRCAGRTGAGAVLGSKKIKGVLFRGDRSRELADPQGVESFARRILAEKNDHAATHAYRKLGTPMMVKLVNEANAFPTGYWQRGRMPDFAKVSAEAMQEACEVRSKSCPRCFMACGKVTTATKGRHAGLKVEGPEYETIYAFGGLCCIDSIEEILHLNDICDRLGMDTISGGNLVAFAMEASRLGAIEQKLRYGSVEDAESLLLDISKRRGSGEILSQGIAVASREWGLEDLAIHVKGLEPAGYDPRILKGMGLAYATSDRGACHLRTTFYKPELSGQIEPDTVEGKAELFVDYEDRANLFDSLIICRFFRDFYLWDELGEILRLTTGVDGGEQHLQALARNIADGARRFNIREGMTKEHDWLPDRFFDEPLPDSGAKLAREELTRMRSEYYALRGWDGEGRPRD